MIWLNTPILWRVCVSLLLYVCIFVSIQVCPYACVILHSSTTYTLCRYWFDLQTSKSNVHVPVSLCVGALCFCCLKFMFCIIFLVHWKSWLCLFRLTTHQTVTWMKAAGTAWQSSKPLFKEFQTLWVTVSKTYIPIYWLQIFIWQMMACYFQTILGVWPQHRVQIKLWALGHWTILFWLK